jgi:hypothetical protein
MVYSLRFVIPFQHPCKHLNLNLVLMQKSQTEFLWLLSVTTGTDEFGRLDVVSHVSLITNVLSDGLHAVIAGLENNRRTRFKLTFKAGIAYQQCGIQDFGLSWSQSVTRLLAARARLATPVRRQFPNPLLAH